MEYLDVYKFQQEVFDGPKQIQDQPKERYTIKPDKKITDSDF